MAFDFCSGEITFSESSIEVSHFEPEGGDVTRLIIDDGFRVTAMGETRLITSVTHNFGEGVWRRFNFALGGGVTRSIIEDDCTATGETRLITSVMCNFGEGVWRYNCGVSSFFGW